MVVISARVSPACVAAKVSIGSTSPGCRVALLAHDFMSEMLDIDAPGARANCEAMWSAELAYAVGLMATDGNLARDGRHMTFVSRDHALVETLRRCLRLTALARPTRTPRGGTLYRVQWGSRTLYDWFLAVGLMPAKSLRLGALAVPDQYFGDFFRGCIDGDGTVLRY